MLIPSGRAQTAGELPHNSSVEFRRQNWTRIMRDPLTFLVVGLIFPFSSFAGLAALMRSGRKMTKRAVASAMLNSGLFGLAVGFGLIHLKGPEHMFFIWCVSISAGLGGNTAIEFALGLWIKMVKSYADKSI